MKKIEVGFFFKAKNCSFQIFEINKRWINEIHHNNEKYTVESPLVSQKIDFTAYGLHKAHPIFEHSGAAEFRKNSNKRFGISFVFEFFQ